jgi:hypothetical protein
MDESVKAILSRATFPAAFIGRVAGRDFFPHLGQKRTDEEDQENG